MTKKQMKEVRERLAERQKKKIVDCCTGISATEEVQAALTNREHFYERID